MAKLNRNLTNLNKHLQSLNVSVANLHAKIHQSIGSMGSGIRGGFNAVGSMMPKPWMGALVGGLAGGAVATVVTGLASRIADGVFRSEEYQAQALRYNRSMGDLSTNFEKANKWGAWIPLNAKVTAMQFGMENMLNKSMESLALKTTATGQNTAALMSTMRQGQVIGGMNNHQLNNLAAIMEESANTYGVSIDTLVTAVGTISNDLRFGVLGITEKMSATVAQLTAKFGPGTEGLFGPFIQKLMDPMTFQASLMTGTMQDIESLMSQGGPGNQQLLKVANKIAASYDSFSQGLMGLPLQLRLQTADMLTGGLGMMSKVITSLQARGKLGEVQDPMSTLSNQFEKMLGPIDLLAHKLFPIALDMLKIIGYGISNVWDVLSSIWNWLNEWIPGVKMVNDAVQIMSGLMEDQVKKADKALALAEKKDARDNAESNRKGLDYNTQSTNRYLMLSSESMKNTLNNIIFQGNLQRKLVTLSEEHLRVLDSILKKTGKEPMPTYRVSN